MMVHDDLCWTSGPVTSPEWYRRHIFPHLKRFIRKVREAGKLIYFIPDRVGGVEDDAARAHRAHGLVDLPLHFGLRLHGGYFRGNISIQ